MTVKSISVCDVCKIEMACPWRLEMVYSGKIHEAKFFDVCLNCVPRKLEASKFKKALNKMAEFFK